MLVKIWTALLRRVEKLSKANSHRRRPEQLPHLLVDLRPPFFSFFRGLFSVRRGTRVATRFGLAQHYIQSLPREGTRVATCTGLAQVQDNDSADYVHSLPREWAKVATGLTHVQDAGPQGQSGNSHWARPGPGR